MSASLAKQFEDYAARCLEIARHSKTRAGRARFMQMAREYQSAASLIQNELSPPEGRPCPPHVPGARLLPPRLLDQWDQLSHAYALVRRESPAEMIQEEMEALQAKLEERQRSAR